MGDGDNKSGNDYLEDPQCANLPSSFLKGAQNKDDFNTYNVYWEENDRLDCDSDIDGDEKYDLHSICAIAKGNKGGVICSYGLSVEEFFSD